MQGRQLVMWMDNFVRPRYSHNPILSGQMTLNATAMAVMYVGADLPESPGLVPVVQLDSYRRASARAVDSFQHEFMAMWGRVLETDLALDDFRVPLDVMRPPQQRVQWMPFGVSGCAVQSNTNLIDLLALAQDVRRQSGRPLPLLLDLDLWYRLVKLSYAPNAVRWKMSLVLRQLPLLYGVWHPYKYVMTMVYRKFHSHFVFLREGTVRDGFACGSKVDLRAVELFMAALLVIPKRERLALREAIRVVGSMVQRLGERVVRLERLIEQESSALRMGQVQYRRGQRGQLGARPLVGAMRLEQRVRDARLQTLRDDLDEVVQTLQRRKDEKNRMVAMLFLIEQYAPACLALGVLVRDCSWRHRVVGSGENAKKVLMAALCILMRLVEREHTLEYVRTLCVALVCWRGWNDQCPGMCYSEERCEAMLSRLGRRCNQYPSSVSASEVEDLFLALVNPVSTGLITLKSHKPTANLVSAVMTNLGKVISTGGSVIRFVPWSSERILHLEEEWPEDHQFPGDLEVPLTLGHLMDVFQYELRVMLRSDLVIGDGFRNKLDANVEIRDDYSAAARLQDLLEVIDRMVLPARYRPSGAQVA